MAILLVDDERRLRQALGRALTAHGHRVHEVGSHAEAVSACAGAPYDVLVLDVNLPDATGWDVLRDLRAAGRPVPAIVVSAVPPSAARIRESEDLSVETPMVSAAGALAGRVNLENPTLVVLGHVPQGRWRRFFRSSLVDQLLGKLDHVDIHLVQVEEDRRG